MVRTFYVIGAFSFTLLIQKQKKKVLSIHHKSGGYTRELDSIYVNKYIILNT